MSDRVPPIARIRLSRFLPRLLVFPVLVLLAGAGAAGVGLLQVPGIVGMVVAGIGAVVIIIALAAILILLSIRLDVEDAALRLGWIGGERVYQLSAGPITRVRLRGQNASGLRARRWGLGWQLGAAVLRNEEQIEVVRLARTPTAILVPTERGRLAIAAADEGVLLDALSRAARARQRLEELTREEPPDVVPETSSTPVEIDPGLMTGIERAVYERRLAEEEREAAMTGAEAGPPDNVVRPAALPAPAEAETAEPEPRRTRRRLPRPSWTARPGPSLVLLFLPLLAAGMAWAAAIVLGRMPEPGTDLGRLTALGLVLAGPATTVGAIMARVYWPRIVGVVVAGGLATAVFVGRSLLG
jgi:hypothetical protein